MKRLDAYWYSHNPVARLLWPLSWLFAMVVDIRRRLYRAGALRVNRFPLPIIAVGNITVGGTGKTPLVIWLGNYLRSCGWRPGIVARGYGGHARDWPQQVYPDSDPAQVGDEAVLVAQRTGCPVYVSPKRPAAVKALLDYADVDIVVSDDGLQHYALGRDIEIAVIDGERRFGNGKFLPAGPLREPISRLRQVDVVITNGEPAPGEHALRLRQPELVPVAGSGSARARSLGDLEGERVHALAGIGNPERFFAYLRGFGLGVDAHPFPDHYVFSPGDIEFDDDRLVLMTEKDAVKCQRFADSKHWSVRVTAEPDTAFIHRLTLLLEDLRSG